MNEKGPTGPDLGPQPEQTPEQIEATRRKYLEALAISIGANETTARMSVDALLRHAGDLASIDYSKDRNDLDPKQAEQIEALGSWLLTGSQRRDQLSFAVGAKPYPYSKKTRTLVISKIWTRGLASGQMALVIKNSRR